MNDRADVPIACTLQSGSYEERLTWIADVARDGLRSHSRQDLVLDLRYAREVANPLRDMVRKEQECCAFLDFELTETSDEVRLTITAPEQAREIADALFDQFVSSSVSAETSQRRPARHVTVVLLILALWPLASVAQTPPARSATTAVLDMVTGIESTLNAVAEEMPADKYEFAPTEGTFRGVRNFARQLKHAAAVQHLVAATILGETVTADMADERGPDAVKTKAEVQQYVKESFAALKRAAATVNEANAFAPFKGPFGEASNTRVGLIVLAVSHSWNHYGQVVPYLRMNGIVPSRTP